MIAPIVAATAVGIWLGRFVIEVRDYAWDDGAITEAYARTFSETGRIALTPTSEVGEGFSSPGWFLLLSLCGLVARPFGGLGYMGFIRAGQGLAVLSAAAGAAMMTVLLRRWLGTPAAALTAVVAFSGANMVNEAMNGMEMLLLCAVAVALLLAINHDTAVGRRWAMGLAFAVPFVRLEALAYLALLGLSVFWWRRRMVLGMGIAAAIGLVTLTATRLVVFGAWVPNTMAAKRLPPYDPTAQPGRGPGSIGISQELLTAWAPTAILLLMASEVMAVVVVIAALRRRWADTPYEVPMWTLAAFGWLFACTAVNWELGLNWGYETRMELSMIPIGIAAAAALGGAAIRAVPWPQRTRPRIVLLLPVVLALVLLQVVTNQFDDLLMSLNLSRARAHSERAGISPHSYRETGSRVDRIRVMLGQDTIVFMVPDAGGTALCCTRITLVDSALLTSPTLTRLGWEQFGAHLVSVSPDVIGTNGGWSIRSGLYENAYFKQNYRPIVISDHFLWLRRDHLEQLESRCTMRSSQETSGALYRGLSVDEEYLAQSQFTVCVFT